MGAEKKSKAVKNKKDFIDYIRQLDRLRWEFLRLSDSYRRDWQRYLDDYILDNEIDFTVVCDNCEYGMHSDQCPECERIVHFRQHPQSYLHIYAFRSDWDLASYYHDLSDANKDVLMKYGLRFFADPSLSYDTVMAELMEDDSSADFVSNDITDADGLIESIATGDDSLSGLLRSLFPEGYFTHDEKSAKKKRKKKLSKREIENDISNRITLLLKALNSLLDDQDLPRKINVKLSAKSRKLLQHYSLNAFYRHRNRIILEEVYPSFIHTSYDDLKMRWHDRFIFYTYLHEYATLSANISETVTLNSLM